MITPMNWFNYYVMQRMFGYVDKKFVKQLMSPMIDHIVDLEVELKLLKEQSLKQGEE